jgi:hypothetical protein
MRITRTDAPKEGSKHDPGRLEDLTLKALQWELTKLTGHDTVEKNRAVLIRRIRELRRQQLADARAKAEAGTPPTTDRLTALTEMNLGQLREEYEKVFGTPSLSRNRKQLIKKIAERIQSDAAAPESPTEPVAKPTLTVKFERKGGKKAGGKVKGRRKTKAALQGKEAAAKRKTRPAGQRDPRLPKPGTTIERVYKGKKLLVRVLEDGFEYQGKPYRSLSALAWQSREPEP